MNVLLTWPEVLLAAHVGVARRVDSLRNNRKPAYGCTIEGAWDRDIEGACGEIAVAKALGIYWSGMGGDLKVDVGPYQVRQTGRANGCLLLHHKDDDDKQFILVTGHPPRMRIAGWIFAGDGKRKQWRKDPTGEGRPAWFVPQSALKDFATL